GRDAVELLLEPAMVGLRRTGPRPALQRLERRARLAARTGVLRRRSLALLRLDDPDHAPELPDRLRRPLVHVGFLLSPTCPCPYPISRSRSRFPISRKRKRSRIRERAPAFPHRTSQESTFLPLRAGARRRRLRRDAMCRVTINKSL